MPVGFASHAAPGRREIGQPVSLQFCVLGPLEVLDGGRALSIGGTKRRALLALLLLEANRVVTTSSLIDHLWGQRPPKAAASSLQNHVSRLRAELGDRLQTLPAGYLLRVEADELDLDRFERLVAEARSEGTEEAADRLRKALALWRGPALADLAEEPAAASWAHLDELRLAAIEDRIDADLALARHDDVISELEALVGEHPFRERLRAQLMLALYRAGRQAEALEAFADARRTMVEELGTEPGRPLRDLHRSVLRQDPALDLHADAAPAVALDVPTPEAQEDRSGEAHVRGLEQIVRRRRLVTAATVVLALAGGIAATLVVLGGSGRPRPAPAVLANSLVQLDPATGRVVRVIPVGHMPVSMALTPGAVWVVNRGDRTVSRVDLNTHTVRTIGGIPYASDIAADGRGNVWVSGSEAAIVTRITAGMADFPSSAAPPETIHVPPHAGALAVVAGYLWVVNGGFDSAGNHVGRSTVSLVDLRSHRPTRSIPVGSNPYAIAVGYGSAWISHLGDATTVSIVRAGSSLVETIPLTPPNWQPLALVTGAGSVWALTQDDWLIRIDPDTRRVVARIHVGRFDHDVPSGEPLKITIGGGYLWVTDRADFSVAKIDPRSNRVVGRIPLGHVGVVPCGILATATAIWVTVGSDVGCSSPGTSH